MKVLEQHAKPMKIECSLGKMKALCALAGPALPLPKHMLLGQPRVELILHSCLAFSDTRQSPMPRKKVDFQSLLHMTELLNVL